VQESNIGEYLATTTKAVDTVGRNSRFCKSGSYASSPQRILISDSTAPPPAADNVQEGSTSNSSAQKVKNILQGVLPKGTPSDPLHVSDSNLSAPMCTRRGAKKKERKPKGGKRSTSIMNRK
jgi:CCR4-NOT transcriptional regulation complex NOT5 subunit